MDKEQEGRLLKHVEHIAETVERTHKTIHGNGREGLVTKVERHEGVLKVIARLFWIGVTAVVVAVAALLIA